jgi:hypothetical protein
MRFQTFNYNCSDKYEIIFIHVPRSAGTTINKLLEIPRERQGHRAPFELLLTCDRDKWENYKKVIICRNPWDRMVSLYHYRMDKGYDNKTGFSIENFNHWLVNPVVRKTAGALEWMSVMDILTNPNYTELKNHTELTDNEYEIDIIPFESLSKSWIDWCIDKGMDELAEKSHDHFKNTWINKTNRGDYRKYYPDEFSKVLVYSIFQQDEFHFGYEFDVSGPPPFTHICQRTADKHKVSIDEVRNNYVGMTLMGDKNYSKYLDGRSDNY